jgi:hypothetical protein
MEDSSVLNSVFFEYMKNSTSRALLDLLTNLKEYVRTTLRGISKTARLGFSSEKELYNICVKIFKSLSIE